MTAKQILDSFSQTLIQDERILSPQERQLLISLLHNAKVPGSNPEVQSAVASTIARSVGETVVTMSYLLLRQKKLPSHRAHHNRLDRHLKKTCRSVPSLRSHRENDPLRIYLVRCPQEAA
jgi:hypothetical protein